MLAVLAVVAAGPVYKPTPEETGAQAKSGAGAGAGGDGDDDDDAADTSATFAEDLADTTKELEKRVGDRVCVCV